MTCRMSRLLWHFYFPLLSGVICDIVATTALVQTVISSGGEVTREKQNCATDKNLEREILCRSKRYIV